MKKFYYVLVAAAAVSMSLSAAPTRLTPNFQSQHQFGLNERISSPGSSQFALKTPAKAATLSLNATKSDIAKAPALAAEDDAWKSLGTVTYTDDFISTFFEYTGTIYFEPEMQESTTTPGLYRLVNPYAEMASVYGQGTYDTTTDHYMIIHAENPEAVYIETFDTGWSIPEYVSGNMICSSEAYEYLKQGYSLDLIASNGFCGTFKNGIITFPVETLLVAFPGYEDGAYYSANCNGAFRIAMSDAKDYSVTLSDFTTCTADGTVNFLVTLGADVAVAKFLFIKGDYSFDNDNYEYAFNNPTGSLTAGNGLYQLTMREGDGRYTLYIVTGDADGNYQMGDGTYFYLFGDNDEQWQSLGEVTYGEDLYASLYTQCTASSYKVELQENIAQPGFYRLKNPYANSEFPYAKYNSHSTDHNHYIFIHAENPEAVYLEDSPVGVTFDFGSGSVNSCYNYAPDQFPAATYAGKLKDGIITFPKASLMLAEQADSHGKWYPVNRNEGFSVEIPTSGIGQIASDADAAPVYYTLQGTRVANPEAGNLYIEVRGSKASKIIK